MTIIYSLVLVATLLTGGAGGCVLTFLHYEQVAAEQEQDEQEMADMQELFAVWAMLHRVH